MKALLLSTLDPYYNLALEESLLHMLPSGHPGYFLLWRNKPSVIIGRHQCTAEEVNATFVLQNNLPVVRRISGGGAVYHDLGNLNFSFITQAKDRHSTDFEHFLQPVVTALATLGVPATLTGRNDLEACGKKISGSSQIFWKDKILHHGTLLINVNMDYLCAVLNVDATKIQSKGVSSVRARVGNISDLWRTGTTFSELLDALLTHCTDGLEMLTPEMSDAATQLVKDKYSQWQWNYGRSPAYTEEQKERFAWGTVCLRLNIQQGRIYSCQISGDFFAERDIADLENLLTGQEYSLHSLHSVLSGVSWEDYFMNCNPQSMEKFFLRNLI